MRPLLRVDNLSARYGGLVAVDQVSFEHNAGAILGVIGPNGAGKSTLLSVLAGIKSPSGGRVAFAGDDVTGMAPHRLCWRGICRTHQTPRPFDGLTTRKNIEVARTFGKPEDGRSTEAVLELCGLGAMGDVHVEQLRPSELRRLELARALATGPRVLLIDEVAAGLPTEEVGQLRRTLRTLSSEGMALIVVEHVMELVMQVADRVLVLDHGRVIARGTPDVVVENSDVVDAYFGEPLSNDGHESGSRK